MTELSFFWLTIKTFPDANQYRVAFVTGLNFHLNFH